MRIFILFSLSLVLSLYAHQQEEFLRANKRYEAGEYKKALEIYTKLEKKGCGVFYNMGNAYYKSGQYPHALACWKKAQLRARGKQLQQVFEQIEKAQKKLGLSSGGFLHALVIPLCVPLSYIPLLFLQLMWLLFLCLLIFIWFKNSGTKRFLHVVMLVMLLSMTICLMMMKYTLIDDTHAIAHNTIQMYAGPNEKYNCVGEVVAGATVHCLDQSKEWYKVSYDGVTGWVPVTSIIAV